MKDPVFQLCDQVRETSFALHRHLRHGYVEKVYENGLAHRLRQQNLSAMQQHPLNVFDEDGTLLGEFFSDLFVERQLIVELKAVRALVDEHVAQLLGYMHSSRMETGLLINFGVPLLQFKQNPQQAFVSS